ncbi:MAG: hypothetical protein JST46_07610 [Bacteroidetes bacterium]|nr:hypothetical protein [Bacteroidota bacterium]
MKRHVYLLFLFVLFSCVPKEQVVLKAVHIRELNPGLNGAMLMKADAVFFNPNSSRMRLKRIQLDVLVDGKKAARIDQQLSSLIKANSDFTVPLKVELNLKELGVLDAILNLLGGKKYVVEFTGSMKMSVNGFPLKVPIQQKEEFKF